MVCRVQAEPRLGGDRVRLALMVKAKAKQERTGRSGDFRERTADLQGEFPKVTTREGLRCGASAQLAEEVQPGAAQDRMLQAWGKAQGLSQRDSLKVGLCRSPCTVWRAKWTTRDVVSRCLQKWSGGQQLFSNGQQTRYPRSRDAEISSLVRGFISIIHKLLCTDSLGQSNGESSDRMSAFPEMLADF